MTDQSGPPRPLYFIGLTSQPWCAGHRRLIARNSAAMKSRRSSARLLFRNSGSRDALSKPSPRHRPVAGTNHSSLSGRMRGTSDAQIHCDDCELANLTRHIKFARMFASRLDSQIRADLESQPSVVLLGPRQVGKTTLALAIAEATPSIYLDLEDSADRDKFADPAELDCLSWPRN